MASRIATTYGNQLIAMLNALPIAAMSLLFLAPMLQLWLWVWGPLRPFGVAEVPAPSLATLYTVGDPSKPLLDFSLAVERVRAARRAIDDTGTGVLLTGRSEGFIVGRPDLAETIRRLTAYAEAGADCLYAPGIRAASEITAVVRAVAPKPVNVLVASDFTTVTELARLGVRRISVGGALARAAWTGFLEAAREIADQGTFQSLGRAVPFAEINGRFTSP